MEHGVTHIPYVFVKDFVSKVITGDSYKNRPVEWIVVYLKSSPLSPHVTEDSLDLSKRRRSSIKITDDEVLVQLCTLLKDSIGNKNSGSTSWGDGDWG